MILLLYAHLKQTNYHISKQQQTTYDSSKEKTRNRSRSQNARREALKTGNEVIDLSKVSRLVQTHKALQCFKKDPAYQIQNTGESCPPPQHPRLARSRKPKLNNCRTRLKLSVQNVCWCVLQRKLINLFLRLQCSVGYISTRLLASLHHCSTCVFAGSLVIWQPGGRRSITVTWQCLQSAFLLWSKQKQTQIETDIQQHTATLPLL